MKVDFELLLKFKTESEDLRQLFWKSFENSNGISRQPETNTLVCDFPEDKQLQFKVSIRKSENILHCRLKAVVDIHWSKAYFYDKFRARIGGILSQHFEVTLYSDDLSGYYAKKCYPILLDYETNLRKIFYFIYHFHNVKEATDIKRRKLNDYVEDLDLSELENLLFSKNWLLVGDSYEFCDINNGSKLYEKLRKIDGKPEFRSMWALYIEPLLHQQDIDEKAIKEIRTIRNKVAHHKSMNFNDWKLCRNEVRNYANKFHEIQNSLIDRKFYRNIGDMAILQDRLLDMSRQLQVVVDSLLSTHIDKMRMTGDIITKAMKSITIPKIDIFKTIAPAMSEIANFQKIIQSTTISQLGMLENDEKESSSEDDEEDKE